MSLETKALKIQKAFADKRIKELNKLHWADANVFFHDLKIIIDTMFEHEYGVKPNNWEQVYSIILRNLQQADLTINFRCNSWFGSQDNEGNFKFNEYEAYTQMYQRGFDASRGPVLKGDSANPAKVRGMIDDRVTLPPSWKDAPKWSKKRKMYDAMNFSGGEGGGDLKQVGAEKDDVYTTTNRHFNPHTKQVFAALNYGRRPHGSTTFYGKSYLILNPELKKKALYFSNDTFYLIGPNTKKLKEVDRSAADLQSTYDYLGHVLLWGSEGMQEAVFDSCHQGMKLEDTGHYMYLLEAHLFTDVRINRDVEACVLAKEDGMSQDDFDICKHFAYIWGRENAVRILLNDD